MRLSLRFRMRVVLPFAGAIFALLLSSCVGEDPHAYKASEIPVKEYNDISKHVAKLMDDPEKSRVYLSIRNNEINDRGEEMKVFQKLGFAERKNARWKLTQKGLSKARLCENDGSCWNFEVAQIQFVKLAWFWDFPIRVGGSGGGKWYYVEVRSVPTTDLGRLFAKSGILECLTPEIGGSHFVPWRGDKTAGSAMYEISSELPDPYANEDIISGCPDMKDAWEKHRER